MKKQFKDLLNVLMLIAGLYFLHQIINNIFLEYIQTNIIGLSLSVTFLTFVLGFSLIGGKRKIIGAAFLVYFIVLLASLIFLFTLRTGYGTVDTSSFKKAKVNFHKISGFIDIRDNDMASLERSNNEIAAIVKDSGGTYKNNYTFALNSCTAWIGAMAFFPQKDVLQIKDNGLQIFRKYYKQACYSGELKVDQCTEEHIATLEAACGNNLNKQKREEGKAADVSKTESSKPGSSAENTSAPHELEPVNNDTAESPVTADIAEPVVVPESEEEFVEPEESVSEQPAEEGSSEDNVQVTPVSAEGQPVKNQIQTNQ